MAYLDDHPPSRSQFRRQRRARVTGAIVVHTAENSTDLTLPDAGAEGVAGFISRRTDGPGSYHSVVDSDSIVRVGRYEWEMFHEGTGGNRWSLGLAFACRASQWPFLPEWWVDGAMEHAAIEAANMAAWVLDKTGITVPAERITPAQYRAGQPGFVGHGELDPERRSDPGSAFPWDRFLTRYAQLTDQETPMPPTDPDTDRSTRVVQQALVDLGYDVDVDGVPGPITMGHTANALPALMRERDDLKTSVTFYRDDLEEERRLHAETRARADRLAAEIDELREGDDLDPETIRKAALLDRLAGATADYADAGDALDAARNEIHTLYGLADEDEDAG